MADGKGPCNCREASPPLGNGDLEALAEIPALDALDRDLDAALAEGALGEGELETALAASELSAEEELAFASVEGDTGGSLDSLVSLLQQYPGIKVTLSF